MCSINPTIMKMPTLWWINREVSYPPKTLLRFFPQEVFINNRLKPVAA